MLAIMMQPQHPATATSDGDTGAAATKPPGDATISEDSSYPADCRSSSRRSTIVPVATWLDGTRGWRLVLVIWALYAALMIAAAAGVVMGVATYTHHQMSLAVFLWSVGVALVTSAVPAVLMAHIVTRGRRPRTRSSV
jgi:hypothetical protein